MLQEALVLVWGQRKQRLITRRSYDDLGRDGRSGLAVAMATRADATLADLTPEEQQIARRTFLRLVQFGEGRPDTRRQLHVESLRSKADDPQVFDRVLATLVDHRLLTPSPDERLGRRVDIAHEMLIVGWPASREWVKSRREAELLRRRLEAKTEEWKRLGRDTGGLLDEMELLEAERWLEGPDASDLGYDEALPALVQTSRVKIEAERAEARRRWRIMFAGLVAGLVVVTGLTIRAFNSARDAMLEAHVANAILTQIQYFPNFSG